MTNTNNYHPTEERINIWSHFIGLILSIIGFILLFIKGIGEITNNWYIFSFIIYGISLIVLYLASTLYHNAKNQSIRKRLNIFDHAAIFILIAGSYTPYALITLHGKTGWILFGVAWSIAFIGALLKLFFTGKYDKLSTAMYLGMGWMVIFALKPLYQNLSESGFVWLVLGGLFYTIGAVFYSINKLKFNHAIFHFFVLFGSISHFISIYFYV